MIPSFEGHANVVFVPMIKKILSEGESVSPRGRPIRELLHQTLVMPDPRKRVLSLYKRRSNPFFQIAETVWILAGSSSAEWILRFNKQLAKFLDQDSKYFHGAYGERLRRYGMLSRLDTKEPTTDQLLAVINELRHDPDSRRAVIVFHHPRWDHLFVPTNDRPCNIAFTFKLRNNKLHMSTFNRSNDAVLGLTFTNICQFTTIQEIVAASLGAEVGRYVHFSDSLHIYEDDEVLGRMPLEGAEFDIYDYVKPTKMQLSPSAHQIPRSIYMNSTEAITCPYWSSVQKAIRAWDYLSLGEGIKALDLVASMDTPDWKVACLEYLTRWGSNHLHGSGSDVVSHYHDAIQGILSEEGFHQRIWQWVFHSEGDRG